MSDDTVLVLREEVRMLRKENERLKRILEETNERLKREVEELEEEIEEWRPS